MDDKQELVYRLFSEALDLPEFERGAFLVHSCADLPEVFEEVTSLLSLSEQAGFLDQAAEDFVTLELEDLVAERDESEAVDRRLGPYRILREVARGGMGVVYLAERESKPSDGPVALKIMRAELAGSEFQARFQYEQKILGALRHPNIARLLDAGTTGDGRPFFVMEYVEGEPITVYSERVALDVERRLDLFVSVCRAVAFAHRSLVIHRDLKPANVLVTSDGEVKLLDFGIARLLDEDDEGAPRTRTGQRLLTPEYASPEQLEGQAVGTASDVFSLGVLLFELLTGVRPWNIGLDGKRRRPSQPVRPSLVVGARRRTMGDGRRLRVQLQGALDTIVLMALHLDPHRRYQSADALIEDLTRFRRGRPVLARPDSRRYRLRKFIQRHRIGVAASAAIAVALVGWLVSVTHLSAVATAERDKARQEAATSQRVVEFITNTFEQADPERTLGEEVTARDLLASGLERLETDLSSAPTVRASIQLTLSRVSRSLGQYELADSLADTALGARQALFGPNSAEVAEALYESAVAKRMLGSHALARERQERALAIRIEGLGPLHPDVLDTQNELGLWYWQDGDYEEAIRLHEATLAGRRQAHGDSSQAVATSLANLGLAHSYAGNQQAAVPLLEEAAHIRRKVFGPDHPQVASALNNLALARTYLGDHKEAEANYREALRIRRAVFGESHPLVAASMLNLGAFLHPLFRFTEAESLIRGSYEMRRSLLGDDHPNTDVSRFWLGRVLVGQDRYREAGDILDSVLTFRRAHLKPGHRDIATVLDLLSDVSENTGRPELAESQSREALAIRVSALGQHATTAVGHANLAGLLHRAGRSEEAREELRIALAIFDSLGLSRYLGRVFALSKLAAVEFELGRLHEADSLYGLATMFYREGVSTDSALVANTLSSHAAVARALGHTDRAEFLLREAGAWRKSAPED